MRASLWAVAVMALGAPRWAFFRRRKAPQGTVGAVKGIAQSRCCSIGAGLSLRSDNLASGDAVVRAQAQPGREMASTSIESNLYWQVKRGAGQGCYADWQTVVREVRHPWFRRNTRYGCRRKIRSSCGD